MASSFYKPLWRGTVVGRTVYLGRPASTVSEKEGSSLATHVIGGHVRRGGDDRAGGGE